MFTVLCVPTLGMIGSNLCAERRMVNRLLVLVMTASIMIPARSTVNPVRYRGTGSKKENP